jgi:drug/metabolite transporter (DMT)-like permease
MKVQATNLEVPDPERSAIHFTSHHALGVVSALTAAVWMGTAEAPIKMAVVGGYSPFTISLCMIAGVFTTQWAIPACLKGTKYVFQDLMEKKHLILWALLAGSIWAVGQTLSTFAIRDIGLTVAFPLWNTNSLVGILWGRVLFGELKGADAKSIAKVLLGSIAIVASAVMLGFSTTHGSGSSEHLAWGGILAAVGASLLWGTMYVPYRKAYISGMNPLSFVTVFIVGQLATMLFLVLAFDGGFRSPVFHPSQLQPILFWLFLAGSIWVVGDLCQQFAAKYIGIGRGIPLANTNQFWGVAWGVLVFGELAAANFAYKLLVVAGSVIMILGAILVGSAVAKGSELTSTQDALLRECNRYGLSYQKAVAAYGGADDRPGKRAWWDYCIIAVGVGVFVWLGIHASGPVLKMNLQWLSVLAVLPIISLIVCGVALWKTTRFS